MTDEELISALRINIPRLKNEVAVLAKTLEVQQEHIKNLEATLEFYTLKFPNPKEGER